MPGFYTILFYDEEREEMLKLLLNSKFYDRALKAQGNFINKKYELIDNESLPSGIKWNG